MTTQCSPDSADRPLFNFQIYFEKHGDGSLSIRDSEDPEWEVMLERTDIAELFRTLGAPAQGPSLADTIKVIRAEECPFTDGTDYAHGWAEAWGTFLNRLEDPYETNGLYANSSRPPVPPQPTGPCPYAEDGMECQLETHSIGPCLCANPVNAPPQTALDVMRAKATAAEAIRTFCKSLGNGTIAVSSDGLERIYYSGISLDALAVAVAMALSRPDREGK